MLVGTRFYSLPMNHPKSIHPINQNKHTQHKLIFILLTQYPFAVIFRLKRIERRKFCLVGGT